jgi:hypothetical protein
VTERRAERYEYAEDYKEHRHLEGGAVMKIKIGECLQTESAGEPEQDEVAAGAQELLASRGCLHVCQHYRLRRDAGRWQRSSADPTVDHPAQIAGTHHRLIKLIILIKVIGCAKMTWN